MTNVLISHEFSLNGILVACCPPTSHSLMECHFQFRRKLQGRVGLNKSELRRKFPKLYKNVSRFPWNISVEAIFFKKIIYSQCLPASNALCNDKPDGNPLKRKTKHSSIINAFPIIMLDEPCAVKLSLLKAKHFSTVCLVEKFSLRAAWCRGMI